MRIRTQIILAAFVLAVVPLAAIVTYSYYSSRTALETVYGREADRLTRQMDRRLAAIRVELEQRLAVVSALPIDEARESQSDVGTSIATVMGEAATFVDAIEFQPVRTRPGRSSGETHADHAPESDPVPAPAAAAPPPQVAMNSASSEESPPPPSAPPPPEAMVIELPPLAVVPRFLMTEEQKELVAEIGAHGAALARMDLDDEQRQDVQNELRKAQEELRRLITVDRKKFEEEIRAAERIRADREAVLARYRQEHAVSGDRPRSIAQSVPVPAPAPVAAVAPTPAAGAVEAAPEAGKAAETSRTKPATKPATVTVRHITRKDEENSAKTARQTALILGRKFEAPVTTDGKVVGQITARISAHEVVQRVLGNATDDAVEIPFALDREGTIYTRTPEDRRRLEQLGIAGRVQKGQSTREIQGWIVSTSTDSQSGLRIGVARPVGENLEELRRTAGRNLGLGLGLIFFAMIGIVPLSNHLTRDVKLVTEGAERVAHGDLMTRLPVKTNNELGQLARAFNRMAEDLSHQQQRLVDGERTRKEQELQQRLMAVEYERKTGELEEARRFQLSMLPKELPHHDAYDVAVFTRTATEVGGDYYDFHLAGDVLSVTIGDATGHGAKAGTMVTVIKTLFAGYGGSTGPGNFLSDAAEKIKRMDLGRMAMALSLGRFERRALTLSSAGMPPVLIHRSATRTVEEIALEATPLGTLGTTYEQTRVELAAGDTVLFLSDGFPELMNDEGQQLGYAGALDAFIEAARQPTASAVVDSLVTFGARWHGDAPPNDDVTFVVVRVA